MSIAVSMVRALVEVVERSGVTREAFLSRAGVTERRLMDEDERFTPEEFDAAARAALDLTGDDALGLHLAESASEAAFDLVGHLVAHAPTLRDAFALSERFGTLLMGETHLRVEEHVTVARVRNDFRRVSLRSDRLLAEFAVAGFSRMIRLFAGREAELVAAHFEHAAPVYRHEYARIFGGAERFGRSFTGLEFPRALLDIRQLHQHPRLYSLLRDEADRSLHELSHGMTRADRVRRYLAARPANRIPTMDVAARELGMSMRSLRRRLAEEGASYRALVRQRLEETAAHVLRSPERSVQEAAHSTGFADAAAFHRAFKHWTGVTPTEFRRRSPSA